MSQFSGPPSDPSETDDPHCHPRQLGQGSTPETEVRATPPLATVNLGVVQGDLVAEVEHHRHDMLRN